MPNNNYFEPIIGSSFDNIASQRAGWARFNEGVDSSNLDRAAQAQRTRNAWLAQVAQMQQADADRQAAAQQRAVELAQSQQATAESNRRFGIQTGLELGTQDINRQKVAAENKHWDWNIDSQNKAEREKLNQISDYAETKAPEIKKAKKDFDAAATELQKAHAANQEAISQIQQENPGAVYDAKARRFKAANTLPASLAAADKAEAAREKANADLDRKTTDFQFVQKNYDQLVKEAQGYGLTVLSDGSVRSPAHKKTWPAPSQSVDSPFESEFSGETSDAAAAMRNPAPAYAGFSSGEDRMTPGSRIPSHRWPNNYGSDSPYAVTNAPLPSSAVRRYNPATGLIE